MMEVTFSIRVGVRTANGDSLENSVCKLKAAITLERKSHTGMATKDSFFSAFHGPFLFILSHGLGLLLQRSVILSGFHRLCREVLVFKY